MRGGVCGVCVEACVCTCVCECVWPASKLPFTLHACDTARCLWSDHQTHKLTDTRLPVCQRLRFVALTPGGEGLSPGYLSRVASQTCGVQVNLRENHERRHRGTIVPKQGSTQAWVCCNKVTNYCHCAMVLFCT